MYMVQYMFFVKGSYNFLRADCMKSLINCVLFFFLLPFDNVVLCFDRWKYTGGNLIFMNITESWVK